MVGFAPYDDPEIAISIVLTQGDTSYNASPIMRDLVSKYFDLDVFISNSGDTKLDADITELGDSVTNGDEPNINPDELNLDDDDPIRNDNQSQNKTKDTTSN